jgi:hypothetical protein
MPYTLVQATCHTIKIVFFIGFWFLKILNY